MAFLIRQLDQNSVGASLKSLRKRQGISLDMAASRTQIQRKYLEAFETDAIQDLPDARYARQLLKLYVECLNGDPAYFVARFDEECGACSTDIQSMKAPRTRMRTKLIRSTRAVAGRIAIAAIASLLLAYVGVQVVDLLSAPDLLVDSPNSNMQTTSAQLMVSGQTEAEVLVRVNGHPVLTDPTGRFTTSIALARGLNVITIEARKKYGRPNLIERNVFLEDIGSIRAEIPSTNMP